jgi:hypothetical protein
VRTILILLLLCGTASAHITLTSPAPRTAEQKTGPCGASGSKRGTRVTTYAPGATITLEWDETVDHPGHYRIAFDSDGDDVFVNPKNPNDNFAFTLKEPIADKVGGHYTQQITLPTAPCENCTLQLMQIMTTQVPYNSFYYQCADIKIGEGGDPGGPAAPGEPGEPGAEGGCSTGSGGGAGVLMILAGLVALRPRGSARRA